ncbi:MAG TPA: hypothetical protein VF363_03305 [Candidatus Eisenbacteria bacterium]
MIRHVLVAAVALLVGIGIVDPYACVQYSSGGSLKRPLSAKERGRLAGAAGVAMSLVPDPPAPYVRDEGPDGDAIADPTAPWNDATSRWLAPGVARAAVTWTWDRPSEGEGSDATPDLDVRVFVNSEIGPPTSLQSVGDTPRLLPVEGATAVEVTTIGAMEADTASAAAAPPSGGRVALPMTAAQAATAVTAIRVLVADPAAERALRAQVEGKAPRATRQRVARVDRIGSITVELVGGKHDVEALARRLPVAKLRSLLDR